MTHHDQQVVLGLRWLDVGGHGHAVGLHDPDLVGGLVPNGEVGALVGAVAAAWKREKLLGGFIGEVGALVGAVVTAWKREKALGGFHGKVGALVASA